MQWPPPEGTGTAGPSQKKGWLYSRSVSLTHNGEWEALPHDAVPANAAENALVQYVAGEPSATAMWAEFRRKIDALVEFFRPNGWASSQEICMQTWSPRRGLRVHFHGDKDASMHTQQGEVRAMARRPAPQSGPRALLGNEDAEWVWGPVVLGRSEDRLRSQGAQGVLQGSVVRFSGQPVGESEFGEHGEDDHGDGARRAHSWGLRFGQSARRLGQVGQVLVRGRNGP